MDKGYDGQGYKVAVDIASEEDAIAAKSGLGFKVGLFLNMAPARYSQMSSAMDIHNNTMGSTGVYHTVLCQGGKRSVWMTFKIAG